MFLKGFFQGFERGTVALFGGCGLSVQAIVWVKGFGLGLVGRAGLACLWVCDSLMSLPDNMIEPLPKPKPTP